MPLLKAKAKINLFFHIISKREDNYHLIESLVAFTENVYDTIDISSSDVNSTEVIGGEFAPLLINEKNNLIDKALNAFTTTQKYNCRLTKNIPIGAGLGGGSSDAAIVSKFLSKNISNQNLAKIGADLPICYHEQPTYCSGIGEIIEPVTDFPKLYIVLVNPRKPLLTKDVFAANTNINSSPITNKPLSFANSANQLIDFLKLTDNVLTDAASKIMPEIKTILNVLEKQKYCALARMSGSGPTCFGVFTELDKALLAREEINKIYPEFWVKYSTI